MSQNEKKSRFLIIYAIFTPQFTPLIQMMENWNFVGMESKSPG